MFIPTDNASVSVEENLARGYEIFQAQTYAQDTQFKGDQSTFRIVLGNTDKFLVDTITGIVALNGRFNYEVDPTYYTLVIQATDSRLPPQSVKSTLNIFITDV